MDVGEALPVCVGVGEEIGVPGLVGVVEGPEVGEDADVGAEVAVFGGVGWGGAPLPPLQPTANAAIAMKPPIYDERLEARNGKTSPPWEH